MSTPPTKRVPPPCWTSDETLALINAYGARWLSLNRGNLRSSDWDAVSSAVSESSPGTSKSSIQCRHKIEKLRKRYRSEKQRSLSFPGRFVSSWNLFPLLDSMNFGSSSAAGFSNQKVLDVTEFHEKNGNDKSLISKYGKIDGDSTPDFALNRGLMGNYDNIDYDDDFEGLETRENDYVKVNGDFGVGFGVKMEDGRNFETPQGYRLKNYKKIDDEKSCPRVHDGDGFPLRTFGDRISVPPPGFKPKNFVKVEGNFNHPNAYYENADYEVVNGSGSGSGSEFYAKTLGGHGDFVPVATRLKNYGRVDGNLNGNVDLWGMNAYDSSSRLRLKKNGDGGVKRELDPFEELVSSITLLTEKFVKMEKMKMEMAKETHKMRMEMEMKHNQMILESQQHILDTFLSGILEKKRKKKVKVQVVSPYTTGRRDGV